MTIPLLSNACVYKAIADESHDRMSKSIKRGRKPRIDGKPGYVIRLDPSKRSFKSALIAIVFSGIYLEALIFITALRLFDRKKALSIDRKQLEDRLKELGIADPSLLERAKRFRLARKELVHEKAIDFDNPTGELLRFDSEVANRAISLANDLQKKLAALGQQTQTPAL